MVVTKSYELVTATCPTVVGVSHIGGDTTLVDFRPREDGNLLPKTVLTLVLSADEAKSLAGALLNL